MAIEKAADRLKVLERIKEYEEKGWFNKDVEDDPPTIPLTPDKCDYLNKKLKNKILTWYINIKAYRFIEKLMREKKLIVKEIKGIENFEAIKDKGMIITCNHFNAFDNFALHYVFHPYIGTNLYKVIREGNFTSFPGLYGLFFRHCKTLPLASSYTCMKMFMEAMDVLLKRGEKILVYPEQGMWWNYRKPRPTVSGAFTFAAKSNAPLLPVFITMNDSDLIGDDGFPIQEYTVHISPAIFPKPELSVHQNRENMQKANEEIWKNIYESTYGIPLTYTTKPQATE